MSSEICHKCDFSSADTDGMDFWERLDGEIERHSNRKRILSEAGVAQNSLPTWKKRGTYPSALVVQKLARALGVTVEYLVTGSDSTDPWIREHRQLLDHLKTLTPEHLQAITIQVEALAHLDRTGLGKSSEAG